MNTHAHTFEFNNRDWLIAAQTITLSVFPAYKVAEIVPVMSVNPIELPYDDDWNWNNSMAQSLDILQRLARNAQQDFREGRTEELDPDEL